MGRSDLTLSGDEYYCYPLSHADDQDETDILSFEPVSSGGAGLVGYLRELAPIDEERGTMRTYLVRDRVTDELAGFFSLKAGLVSTDETTDDVQHGFDTVPGIELANYAVNGKYRSLHPGSKGCGALIFRDLVLPLVRSAADIVGVYLLYIYSLPFAGLMRNYASYGFSRLPEDAERLLHARLKPRYDKQCIFMYMVL